jgi:hypothetical protein
MVESTTALSGGSRSDCDCSEILAPNSSSDRDGKGNNRIDNALPGPFSTGRTAWHRIADDALYVPARHR